MTSGQLLRWEVKVKIPMCPTHPTWEEWEVKAQGLNLVDTVQKAALEVLTTFCEKHAVTPSFKGKTECIDHVCARIKLHTCLDIVNTKISATRIKSYYKP
jgi:hypothetical protein